jgi:reactive intermediate/imine deaminase
MITLLEPKPHRLFRMENPMTHIGLTVDIHTSPDRVWSVLRDVERWPEWTPTMTSVQRVDAGAPFGVGSRARIRQPKLPPAEWRVTELDEGRSFAWVAKGRGVQVTARHAVETAQGGSRATLSLQFSGLLGPLAARLTGGLTRRYLALEAAGLKKRAELWPQVVESARVPRIGPYSQAVRVGELLFTAGQPGINPATGLVAGPTFEEQARQALENLRAVLEDGGSSMDHVVKATCFVADAAAFPTLNRLFEEYFPAAPPVRSTPVVSLPQGLLFSIDAVAVALPRPRA